MGLAGFSSANDRIQISEWTARVREPRTAGPHPVLLLVHGWTGDEDSMWVFTQRLPGHYLLIAPRGLHPTPLGGYGWQKELKGQNAAIADLLPAAEALFGLLTPENFPSADFEQLRAIGFSQGAALVYTMALTHPQRLQSLAGLASFMPVGAEAYTAGRPLEGKPVLLSHGVLDDIVPVERARQAAALLDEAGAVVTLCEDNVGHKLGAGCFRALGKFF